jgi:hypothetical protein
MHLKFTLATFLIAVPVALATPQAPLGVELADCINLSLTNCHIDLEWTGNFLCVCSNDEDNEPLSLLSLKESFHRRNMKANTSLALSPTSIQAPITPASNTKLAGNTAHATTYPNTGTRSRTL